MNKYEESKAADPANLVAFLPSTADLEQPQFWPDFFLNFEFSVLKSKTLLALFGFV